MYTYTYVCMRVGIFIYMAEGHWAGVGEGGDSEGFRGRGAGVGWVSAGVRLYRGEWGGGE